MAKAPVTIPEDRNVLLTETQMSILFNRGKSWFQKKRLSGGGIPYIKLDGIRGGVLYRREDGEKYFSSRMCKSTSESSTKAAA